MKCIIIAWCLEHVVLKLKLIIGMRLHDTLPCIAVPTYLVNIIETGNEWSVGLSDVYTLSWHEHRVA
jgi:hypothetical protein